jgi:hypothetical protein
VCARGGTSVESLSKMFAMAEHHVRNNLYKQFPLFMRSEQYLDMMVKRMADEDEE